jgi:hypothetical protein
LSGVLSHSKCKTFTTRKQPTKIESIPQKKKEKTKKKRDNSVSKLECYLKKLAYAVLRPGMFCHFPNVPIVNGVVIPSTGSPVVL